MTRPSIAYLIMVFAVPVLTLAQTTPVSGEMLASLPDCPARIRTLGEPPGKAFDCKCTVAIQKTPGTVKLFGSGPYDSVSNICLAAIHAGVTPREGGPVRVIPRPPQSSFQGSTLNGIMSLDWGSSLFNTFDVAPISE